jgi:hypothetical protein
MQALAGTDAASHLKSDSDFRNADVEREEEEYEETDEEDAQTDEEADKRQFGIYQALPVDDREPDWATEEPESVEEYLRRVR